MSAAQDPTVVELRLFGPPSVRVRGKLTSLQPKRLALLSYLTIAKPGSLHRRDVLLALFWPDCDSGRARASLRQALTGLRQALGDGVIVTQGDEGVGVARERVSCDVCRFGICLNEGDLDTAIQHYGGPLMHGVFLRGCHEFECWAEKERAHLEKAFTKTLEQLARTAETAGDMETATRRWDQLVDHEPTNAHAVLRVMTLLEAAQDRAAALRIADRHVAAWEEVAAAPNPAVVEMAERMKQEPRGLDVAPARVRSSRDKRRVASVAAVAVTMLTLLGIGLWGGARPTAPPIGDLPRLVVLPFDNVGPHPTAYVVDGFTEEINSRLARISGLYVTSRTSASLYKGRAKPLRDIGEELNVAFALAGAVRIDTTGPSSGRIRITAELLRIADGQRLWSDHFSAQFAPGAIFDVQSDIANEVARALNVVLIGSERVAITSHPTDNADAFDLYLLGRFHWNKRSQAGLEQAASYFEQAIQQDTAYALAYAGLADVYAILSAWGFAVPNVVNPKGKAAAHKALELDSTLAEAYVSLGWITFAYDRDWKAAESYFRRAIALNPRYATAHHWYSIVSLPLGRFDTAHAAIQRARQLSPLSMIINTQIALPFYYNRQHDAALEHFLAIMAIDSLYPPLLFELGEVYMAKGMYEDAVRVLARSNQISPNSRTRGVLGMAYGMAGRRDEAMAVLRELRESASQQYVPATAFAWLFIGLGEADSALSWLERAYEDRNWHLLLAGVDTHFDPLRGDPRFEELLARLNLPS